MKKMMIILTIMVMVMVAGCGKKEDNVDCYITASVVFDDGSIYEANKTYVNGSEIIMTFAYDENGELVGERYWIDECEVSDAEVLAFCGQ